MGEIADWITSGDPRDPEEALRDEIESNWAEGFHTTREGDEIRLEDMTELHLKNTIKFFEGKEFDVSPLEAELASRGDD